MLFPLKIDVLLEPVNHVHLERVGILCSLRGNLAINLHGFPVQWHGTSSLSTQLGKLPWARCDNIAGVPRLFFLGSFSSRSKICSGFELQKKENIGHLPP